MPQVPEITSPSVEPGPAPDITQHIAGISPDAFGAGIGQALTQVGEVTARQAESWQSIQNQADIKNSYVDATTKIGLEQNKLYSMTGKAANDYLPTFIQNIQDIRKDALASTTNPAVQRGLDNELASTVAQGVVTGSRHAGQQMKEYGIQSSSAAIQLAQSQAAQADDDSQFQTQLGKITDEVNNKAKLGNWSPEQTQLELQKEKTGAWASRLDVISEKNPLQARELFNHIRGDLDGAEAFKIQQGLDQKILQVGAKGLADGVIQGGPTQSIQDKENYAMAQLTPVLGHYGAAAVVGGMSARESHLDPTIVNKGDATDGSDSVGIAQWNSDRLKALRDYAAKNGQDPSDFKTQVGYLKYEVTQGLRSNVAPLLRAASSAEDATAIANAKFEGSGDKPGEGGYNQRLAGTQRLAAGGLRQPGIDPTNGTGQLERAVNEVTQQASAAADKYFPDNPAMKSQFIDNSVQRVRQQFNIVQAEHRDNVNEATQTVYDGMNSGKFTSWDQIKADPEIGPQLNSLPGPKQDAMQRSFTNSQKVQYSPEGAERFNTLMGLAKMDPKEFLDVPLEEERLLTQNQTTSLMSARRTLIKNAAADPNVAGAMKDLGNQGFFTDTGIDSDKAEKMKFSGALFTAMQNFKEQNKRDPKFDEIKGLATDLMKTSTKSSSLNPFSSDTKGYAELAAPIPDDVKANLVGVFRKNFPQLNRDPGPGELNQLYYNYIKRKQAAND